MLRRLFMTLALALALPSAAAAATATPATRLTASATPSKEMLRWREAARRITITRDDWGIAHIRGKTDADAVFGMIYAQAEDDFPRIETNYLTALGRLAEAEGESALMQDLRARLYTDPETLKAQYAKSPPWLRKLMDAWADGLNYYLAMHPQTRPRVLTRFEPWMALSFSEGSIGGDIERISLDDLAELYSDRPRVLASAAPAGLEEPRGSNGIAIGPSRAAGGRPLLLINPHTSFYFRAEQQVTSDAGLNVYGAATWGQFFIYQGFNPRVGWMHTSSGVDAVDEFSVQVINRGGRLTYRYGAEERPVITRTIVVDWRTPQGALVRSTFRVHFTHHGPVVRKAGDRWVAFAMMNRPVEALSQSFLRTRAANFDAFMKAAALQGNASNNTLYADADGVIAYLHPQFVPKRDDRFDYTRPVDGSDPATDWKGLHALSELPAVKSPKGGWLYNTNDWPWTAAGPESPRREAFPRYMDTVGPNPRGANAVQLLEGGQAFTLDSLVQGAFNTRLPAFDQLLPGLEAAWDAAPGADPLRLKLADDIRLLRGWNRRWSAQSEALTLAVFWGDRLWPEAEAIARKEGLSTWEAMASRIPPRRKLEALSEASDRLQADFGSRRVPWGEVNRFQRRTGDIQQAFSDAAPSLAVPFPSARWGALASFGARRPEGQKRLYGTSGNSFVAVVEFGPRVRARAVTAGGASSAPGSRHFTDQAPRYLSGDLRPVYFWPDEIRGHVARTYRPGQ
jgi:acyl-homoserine-lactone acylase